MLMNLYFDILCLLRIQQITLKYMKAQKSHVKSFRVFEIEKGIKL